MYDVVDEVNFSVKVTKNIKSSVGLRERKFVILLQLRRKNVDGILEVQEEVEDYFCRLSDYVVI